MLRFGIDLGTTNTCIYKSFVPSYIEEGFKFSPEVVRIWYKNRAELEEYRDPEDSMPSVIYGRLKEDGRGDYDFFLGSIANRLSAEDDAVNVINPKRVLCNTKRLFCMDDPSIKIEYGLTARDIAQKLLEGCYYSMQHSVSSDIALTNSDFTITQPAAFGIFASQSIPKAAEPAGIHNADVLREPIAALLSFLYKQLENETLTERLFEKQKRKGGKLLTLVVDIGGGTTDVTIQEIKVTGSRERDAHKTTCYTGYNVRFINQEKLNNNAAAAANQEPAFGGIDFDEAIVSYIVEEWDKEYTEQTGEELDWEDYWRSPEGERVSVALYARVQKYKNSLSEIKSSGYDESVDIKGQRLICTVNPETVYKVTRPLCYNSSESEERKTIYGIIADTVRRSGYNINDVDYLFVTGGMSKFKPVRDMMREKFAALDERGALTFSDRPLDDIALGASLYNSYFSVEMSQSVLYADLIMDNPCGEPRVLVSQNEKLPIVKRKIDNFIKLPNPAYLYIDVLWGNGVKDSNLKLLRRLRSPLPKGKVSPLGTDISVECSIDTHQAVNLDLIIHDKQNGDYKVELLNLIEGFDFTKGE